MSFLIYDLVFLAVFLAVFSIFLYTRKKNLKREGIMYLYKTSWGINLINRIGNKYRKTIKLLSFVSISIGYILMAVMIYLTYQLIKIYFFAPDVVRAVKVPPIMPLVPYLPQIFNLSFLPPFYFTYWIVIIAIIAITHEMAHGIFASYNKVKIKTTGFGFFPFFLPIFLAAFVELDEKVMQKKKKFAQMAILSAGVFANILTAILFFAVLALFFISAFSASGIIYDSYATALVPLSGITMVNGINVTNASYEKIIEMSNNEGLNELADNSGQYLATKELIEKQKGGEEIYLYHSAPAIKENLSSIIVEINNVRVLNMESLISELSKYSPGDEISVKTIRDEGVVEQKIVLEENPNEKGKAWLGIGFVSRDGKSAFGKIISAVSFKKPNVYYEPKIDGWSVFIYNLLWWLVLISISVALINMLPIGIFDGGRFFYLTILGITKSEKIAKNSFVLLTKIFLALVFLLLILWGISFFR